MLCDKGTSMSDAYIFVISTTEWYWKGKLNMSLIYISWLHHILKLTWQDSPCLVALYLLVGLWFYITFQNVCVFSSFKGKNLMFVFNVFLVSCIMSMCLPHFYVMKSGKYNIRGHNLWWYITDSVTCPLKIFSKMIAWKMKS